MGMAEFLKKRFTNKEICLELDDGEAETITWADVWAKNVEVIQGVVKDVDEGVLVLNIPDVGSVYIDCHHIKIIWTPGTNWDKASKASITARPITANRR